MTDYVERNGRRIPVIPKLPETTLPDPGPCDPNPVVSICGECGLEIYQVMGYVCHNTRCPCGLGGATCLAHYGP